MMSMSYHAIAGLRNQLSPELGSVFVNWIGCSPGGTTSHGSDDASPPPPEAMARFVDLAKSAAMASLRHFLNESRRVLVASGKLDEVLKRLGLGGRSHPSSPMLLLMDDEDIQKVGCYNNNRCIVVLMCCLCYRLQL